MKASQIIDSETAALLIEAEIKSNPEGRYFHRLHLLLLLARGMTCPAISKLYGEPVRNIQRWVNEFNENGLDALKDLYSSGRPSKLSKTQLQELKKDIERSPQDFGFVQGFWDGPLLSHHISLKYKVSISVRQCQRYFRQLGFTLLRPRSKVSGSSEEAREDFKKT